MEKFKQCAHRCIGTHYINTVEKSLLVLGLIISGAFALNYSAEAYPEIFGTSFEIEKREDVKLNEPVIIDFSLPVFPHNYDLGVAVSPEEKISLRWDDSRSRLFVYPQNYWQAETQYKLILPDGKNIMLLSVKNSSLDFSTQKLPKVTSVSPKDKALSVMVDIEDPIVIRFENNAGDFFLKFMLNGSEKISVENNPEKTEFRLMPERDLEYSARYSLEVYARYAQDKKGDFKKIHESSFVTAPPPNIVWDKNFSIRLEQARKYTTPKKESGKYIDINLSSQIMSMFENGKILNSYMVSSGKRGMDTPKMETQVYNKAERAFSSAYGLYMPHWMAITPDGKYGIHELPEWPGGYKEGASHLGIPVSHGCVRLGIGASKSVYDWAEVGTPIIIY